VYARPVSKPVLAPLDVRLVPLPHFLREPVIRDALDSHILHAQHVTHPPTLTVIETRHRDQPIPRLVDPVVVVAPTRSDVFVPELRSLFVPQAAGPPVCQLG